MRRRDASLANVRLITGSLLLALLSIHAISSSAELSDIEIKIEMHRQNGALPDRERTMSVDEVISNMGLETWAESALLLRIRFADEKTRKNIYEKLVALAVEKDYASYEENLSAGVGAIIVLGLQDGHRDEAATAILTILDTVENPITRINCYEALGNLGGPLAIETLKEAILWGPRTLNEAVEMGFSIREGTYEYYQVLYNSMASCGPDAGSALVEIDEALGEGGRKNRYRSFRSAANEEVVPYLLGKVREAQLAGDIEFLAMAITAVAYRANKFTAETRQEILALLLDHAEDPDYRIREAVARCLGQAGDASHMATLEHMLADTYSFVKTLWVLPPGAINSADAVETPKETFPVQEAATLALKNLQRRIAIDATDYVTP